MARKPQFRRRAKTPGAEEDEVEPGEIRPNDPPTNFKFGFDESVKFNWR